MKEMRPALWSDMERLKAIWKLCFGDGDSFIDFYFARRFHPEQVAVYLVDQVITAMLTMIPIQYVDGPEGQKTRQGAMLYAIATHPDFQRRGMASELMEWARSYLGSRQAELCVLVPAEEKLFGFYERQGYQAEFTLREAVLNRDEIRVMGEPPYTKMEETPDFAVAAALPQTYNSIRNQLLRGTPYIAYGEEEVAYQKQVSRLSGADLYELSSGGVQGCAAVECLTEDKVLVKELLVPETLIAQGLKALAQTIPAQEFIIRTPAPWGQEMGGQIRSFGMLKRTSCREWGAVAPDDGVWGKTAYLGLAFD
ncbi:GNAT family N-acetyltransferase [Desulfitobacterium chlororespirans]|uniref:Ribosomal protein S18 acetylase RimI n=1 Tax=Desulfitobacterium chlororespirans DSM 11544 TaxID=1121395 RepID=A0A1M7U075_9FIRM|nr:GNAT family N-acetyltransferase [Desulfitobacterium chlororespirans]SHN76297.1 Ribosomal protein S18 acetylase RimI [Desulfitobacterium chlororespirans DSM 11544]